MDEPGAFDDPKPTYFLTRFTYLRGLGFIYSVAFLILHDQMLPLFGSRGLEPARLFMARVRDHADFWRLPTLFFWNADDDRLGLWMWIGLALSLCVFAGVENALVMAALWAIYMSFVHVGQDFYGYGWEILLLEAGFLAIFLCPVRSVLPLRDRAPTPLPLLLMLRWLVFRLMFGAGLIKIRGDQCWRDLTCLAYHYETQPVPHPLSWLLHQAPLWFHQVGTLTNHFVELVVPWFLFGPRTLRNAAALVTMAFQTTLILSGNLSFLNWLTIVVCMGCLDDGLLLKVWPARIAARARELAQQAPGRHRARDAVVVLLSLMVLARSYAPVMNLLSPHQRMNSSFDALHLVNSYGAFGSVGKTRDEVILQGTRDGTHYVDYALKCKPGDVMRRPCLITPYHYRLDWQMWFAALSDYRREPWIVNLVDKLLHNDPGALSLLADNPFPDQPPRYVRAERYRYRFTHLGDGNPAWWTRERIGPYLPPMAQGDARMHAFLLEQGLVER